MSEKGNLIVSCSVILVAPLLFVLLWPFFYPLFTLHDKPLVLK